MPYSKEWVNNLFLTTGLEIDRQKQDLVDANSFVEFSTQKNKTLIFLSSNYRITYNGDNDLLNTGYVHLRIRFKYKNKIHPETFIQYQWDDVRGVIYRELEGANLRYNNYVNPKLNIIFGLGFMHEREKWNYIGVTNPDLYKDSIVNTDYIKVNSYLKFELKTSDNSDLFFTTFYQFRPDSYYYKSRIANSLKWQINISKKVQMITMLNCVWDAYPVVPIRTFYFSFTNGLTFKI